MDSGILTDILGSLVNATSQGFDVLRSNAEDLFFKLLVVEIAVFGLGVAINRIDVQRELTAKIIAIGFVQFVLFRYVWLIDGLRDGFVALGINASGSNISVADLLDPSAYLKVGFDKVFAIIEARFDEHGMWTLLTTPGLIWLLHGVVVLLMFFAFAAVGLQIFLAVTEFYIISTLAIIFVPFLVIQKTSFLGLRALNGIISICIKLTVIAFIASLAAPVIESLTFTTNEPSIRDSMSLAVGALAIALLMWRAPSIAMSLISGSIGSDVGSALIAPVLGGANAAGMAVGIARSSSRTVGNVAAAASTGVSNGK